MHDQSMHCIMRIPTIAYYTTSSLTIPCDIVSSLPIDVHNVKAGTRVITSYLVIL